MEFQAKWPTISSKEIPMKSYPLCGHHDYGIDRDEAAAEILRKEDVAYVMVQNTIVVLGCAGDAMIRDCISNGLDTAIAFDITSTHIVYHGPRDQMMGYFANLGYECPELVDEANFLQ
eukprot:scaffold1069_cov186-Ochromonas_danica.AAC.6